MIEHGQLLSAGQKEGTVRGMVAEAIKTVAVTGSDGFLGWHLGCRLKSRQDLRWWGVARPDLESADALASALGTPEAVLHLAGMNRGPDQEVHDTNIRLARQLIEVLDRKGIAPTILFANSVHSLGESPYGRGKREAAALLSRWAKARGARFLDVLLPHLFGEGGKPFYNSAFATFCHQLVQDQQPQIQVDGQLELVHAQRVAQRFLELLASNEDSGQVQVPGAPMRVSEALQRLQALHATYAQGIIPCLTDPLELDFFNTYRSYHYPEHYPVVVPLHQDARGGLFEAVKSHHGGQAFLSTTHPGITRGRHYHHHKVERFLVVAGTAEIRIRRLLDSQVQVFRVTGSQPCYIDIPTLHTHEISNVGDQELLTMFWSHEIFNPLQPDTYLESVTMEP